MYASFTTLTVIIISIVVFVGYQYYNSYKYIDDVVKTPINSNETQYIPKIIIQTWKTSTIPSNYLSFVESIKQHNPQYKYMFFTDADIETFLKTHYLDYYQTYIKLPIKIQRIDFFRYIAVYHYGGFYMDLDMDCLQPFDELLKYKCVFPVDEIITKHMSNFPRYKSYYDRGYDYLLGQYAFAAEPKNQFIKAIIDKIHNSINKYIKQVNFDSHDYVYKTTGPDLCTDLYMDYHNKKDIYVIHNNKRQYFGDYAKHNYLGTWK